MASDDFIAMTEVIYMDEATFGGSAQDRQRLRRWLNEGLDREEIEEELADLEQQRRAQEVNMPELGVPVGSSARPLPQGAVGDVDPDVRTALANVGQRKERVKQRIAARTVGRRVPAPPASKPPMHPDVPEELRDRWERAPYKPLPPATDPESGPVPFPMLDQPFRPSS